MAGTTATPPQGPWRRSPRLLHRQLLDGHLLLALDRTDPVALLGTAAALWDELAEPTTTDALVARLVARFAGDPAVVATDVAAALAALAEERMVEPAARP